MPFRWRHFVCLPMVFVLPVSLLADDVAGAVLHSNGVGVLVNKYPAPASAVLFDKDLVETEKNAVARIEMTGSAADVNPETIVEFDLEELVLDHGSLSVETSRGLRVRIGCLTVTPVNSSDLTQYEVTDLNGQVTVLAHKNDVYIDANVQSGRQVKQPGNLGRAIVRQGEQESRDENCGQVSQHPTQPGLGAALDSPWAVGTALGGGVLATCLGLCHGDDPISPAKP